MGRLRLRRLVPEASVAEAEALWCDTARWPAFVDGFGHLDRVEGRWPEPGSRVVWDSPPGGRGRVLERVSVREPGAAHVVEIEDARLVGTRTLSLRALPEGCEVSLELAYRLKQEGLRGALADLLFVRRALRESLRGTLVRFDRELVADRELASP